MTKANRFWLLALSVLVTLPLAGLASAASQADGPNLLNNPGFESPYSKQCCQTDLSKFLPDTPVDEVQVAVGWFGWWLQPDLDPAHPGACDTPGCVAWHRPEWREANCGEVCANRIRSGSNAQKYFTFYSVHDAGMYQPVSGITPGARLRFSVHMQGWSTNSDYGPSSGQQSMGMRVGIDPTGGTNPFSPNVIWSAVNDVYDAWGLYVIEAVARSSTITVYTRSTPVYGVQHNDIYVDDASLVVVGSGGGSPAPTAVSGITYIVRPGDNFYRIGRKFGVSASAIIAANKITNPNILRVGQTLIIPGVTAGGGPAPAPAPVVGGFTYIVQRGDNLYRLARRFGTTVQRIKQINGLTSDIIFIGQTLLIAP